MIWKSCTAVLAAVASLALASGARAADVTLEDPVSFPTSQVGAVQYGMAPDGTFWVTYRESSNSTTARFDHLDAEGNNLGDGFTAPWNGWAPMAIDYYGGRVYAAQYSSSSFGFPIVSYQVESTAPDHGRIISDIYTSQRLDEIQSIRIGANGVGVVATGGFNKIGLLNFADVSPTSPFYPQRVMGNGINTHPLDPSPGWESCGAGVNLPGGVSGDPEDCGDWAGRTGPNLSHLNKPFDTALANNAIFVLESGDDEVTVLDSLFSYDPSGNWGASGSGNGQLSDPYGMAYHPPSGHLLISDQNNRRISEYTLAGGWVRSFGWGVFTGADRFEVCGFGIGACRTTPSTNPRSYYTRVDVGPDGKLYATAPLSGTLEVFSFDDTPDPKAVTLTGKPLKVRKGRRTTLTAKLTPCADSIEDRALFQVKDGNSWDNLAIKSVNDACRATTKAKINRKSKFRAQSIDPGRNLIATSRTLTVKVR